MHGNGDERHLHIAGTSENTTVLPPRICDALTQPVLDAVVALRLLHPLLLRSLNLGRLDSTLSRRALTADSEGTRWNAASYLLQHSPPAPSTAA